MAYILAFTLAVVTVGVFLRWHIARLYEQDMTYWQARQSSIADDRAQTVSDWLKERQHDAQLFATHPSARSALHDYYDTGRAAKPHSGGLPELMAVLDEMARLYSYAGVYVLDRDAKIVARSSRSAPLDSSLIEFSRAVAHSRIMRTEIVGDAPQRSLMSFGVPVFPGPATTDAVRAPGQPLGVVLVMLDASQTLFPTLTRESVPTRTGETLLVRGEGNDIVFFSPLRLIPAGSPQTRFPLSTAPTPARLALEGRNTFAEYNDYRGVPVLAATRHIPVTGWGMVLKIDRAEAMEEFRRMAIAEGLAGSLLVILLGGLLLIHRRDVTTRVLKQEEGTGLNSIVDEVKADLRRSNPDRVIEWKVDTLPFVECDPGLMKQVFANLLANAVKFTRPRNPAVIEVGVTDQEGVRAIFVRDDGAGFSMKYATKLFGVFQRLHCSEYFEGTGVRLATVQRIIHKHGGRIWTQAELDKGATFSFTVGS